MYYNVQSVLCNVSLKFACARAQPIHLVAHRRKTGAAKFTRSQDISGNKNILLFQQIHLAIWRNTFCHANKYILQFVEIHFRMKTHSSGGAARRKTCKFIGSQDISGGSKCRIFRHWRKCKIIGVSSRWVKCPWNGEMPIFRVLPKNVYCRINCHINCDIYCHINFGIGKCFPAWPFVAVNCKNIVTRDGQTSGASKIKVLFFNSEIGIILR